MIDVPAMPKIDGTERYYVFIEGSHTRLTFTVDEMVQIV